MAGGAQAKMSTWFSKPNQSLISKVTKKRVGFNLKILCFRSWKLSIAGRGGILDVLGDYLTAMTRVFFQEFLVP